MEEILAKGSRLRQPRAVNIQLRPEVYDWLCTVADQYSVSVRFLIRSLIENDYDLAVHSVPDQEVSGDE